MSENAPLAVASAIASATALEPVANLSISNTPTGPFQRIVLHSLISSAKSSLPLEAMSTPSQASGIAFTAASSVLAFCEKSSAIRASGDVTILIPFSSAFFKISNATGNISGSQIDLPTLPPCAAANVYVIPPPMIILSHFSINFSMIVIFVDTFEPPTIATKGRWGLDITPSIAFNSFSIT